MTPSSLRALASTTDNSTTVAVVAGVGGIVLLVVLAAVVRHCLRKRMAKRDAIVSSTDESVVDHYALADDEAIDWGGLTLLQLDSQALTTTRKLATGNYYDVYEGSYRGVTVFLKALVAKRRRRRDVQRFVDALNVLGTCAHPCILSLVGVAWTDPSNLLCVLEHMDMGSLRSVLEASPTTAFGWTHKVFCVLHMAQGLAYLHSRRIVHGALNTKNVILDSKLDSKLANVGLSKADVLGSIGPGVWWMAPEMLTAGNYSPAIDVYAFGMVLVEMDSHRRPSRRAQLTKEAIAHIVQEETTSPRFSTMCPDWIQDLALLCIARNPEHRPRAATWVNARLLRDANDNGGVSIGLIVGASVAGTTLLAALGFCWFARYRKKQEAAFKEELLITAQQQLRSARRQLPVETVGTSEHHSSSALGTMNSATTVLNWGDLDLLRIDSADVVTGRKLASGAYGEIFLGSYHGQAVAIKTLLTGHGNRAGIQKFMDEINLLGRFDSPYVVSLVGVAWTRPTNLQCVLEYMDLGDLKEFLAATSQEAFPLRSKLDCARNIAEGLVYLHSMKVIHRDLKSRNVLLDSMKGTKLTDFGTSREATTETMTVGVGTYRWMAPEILTYNQYTVAADVYSFGVIISELDTHRIPYSDRLNERGQPLVDTAIMGLVMAGQLSPSFSEVCPSWLRELALQCLAHTPDDRPTMMHISHTLASHLRN
ncbi:protein kinase [Achlya hypogyna]|uniref:Protein kinase n=1 Tax=Achlya hypogyna TaxID=1202772 RepID=A0A1V9ZRS0_ACHHY|nr:protein kinase [Achlya hypogyna]